MRRTVIKSRKHGLTKISFKTLNFPMGWDGTGGGGCETTPTVGNFDVYMVTTACNDFVHYSIVGSRY